MKKIKLDDYGNPELDEKGMIQYEEIFQNKRENNK